MPHGAIRVIAVPTVRTRPPRVLAPAHGSTTFIPELVLRLLPIHA